MRLLGLSFMLLALLQVESVLGQFNMTTYRLMPPLYRFDNYDECLEKEKGTYCALHIEIKSDESNPIWREIESVSSDYKRHYRHDYLNYGVCLERCAGIQGEIDSIGDTDVQTQLSCYRYKDIVERLSKVFNSDDNRNDRLKYGKVLSVCLNEEFKRKYNLSVETFVQYCEKGAEVNESKSQKTDTLNLISYVVFRGLVVLTIFSSLYDFLLKKQQPECLSNVDFYKTKHRSLLDGILTAFSISRNYFALTSPSDTHRNRELRFLDGIKGLLTILVIFAHILLFCISGPLKNPELIESYFHADFIIKSMGLSAGMQIFFCITSFLLFVNFKTNQSVNQETPLIRALYVWLGLVVKRYFRLMTGLGLVMLFSATFFSDLVTGPMAASVAVSEKLMCRNNWYLPLFAVNNNYRINESCVQQSWFTSADVQLYIIFSMILITITRYPKLKVPVYLALIVLSSGIPALVTYIQQTSGFISINPNFYRYLYFQNSREFFETYMAFYYNLSGYTYGFIAGEIYWQMKKSKFVDKPNPIIAKITENITRNPMTYNSLLLISLGSLSIPLYCGTWFMENDTTTYLDLLYVGLNRTVWSIVTSLFILGFTLKLGWILYDFFCMPILQTLGRISFQVYLWHTVVLRLLISSYHDVFHASISSSMISFFAIYVMSQQIGFVLTLIFEYPGQNLLKGIAAALKPKANKTDELQKSKGL